MTGLPWNPIHAHYPFNRSSESNENIKWQGGRREKHVALTLQRPVLEISPSVKADHSPKMLFWQPGSTAWWGCAGCAPFPRAPLAALCEGSLFPPHQGFQPGVSFAVPSPRGTAHHTHAASLGCSKKSPPASWATRTNFVRSTPPISNIRSNWSGVQYLLPGIHVY